jgi:hypothetical protein
MSRLALIFLVASALLVAEEPVNLEAVHRIRTEAFENSQVMDTCSI